ncbi:hypothetical protein BGX27_005782, partial [Mortierella sp. AM989]
FLINKLIADVNPTGLTVRQRGKLGFRGAIVNMTLEDARNHLQHIRGPDFDPHGYGSKGYVLTGSIRTNGFRLQLLACKLKELQAVRYRRLPDAKLPSRLTSTVGGTNFYLQEIRNVVKTKEDVVRFWPHCPPEEIKVLALDCGQAYVVAGNAYLPGASNTIKDTKGKVLTMVTPAFSTTSGSRNMLPSAFSGTTETESDISPMSVPSQDTYCNIAVNQKAVYQPTFKHRRWVEGRKKETPEGATLSIQEIESRLPPLRGPDRDIKLYVEELEKAEQHLDIFYNGLNRLHQSHAWDEKRARQDEYIVIANRLLKL